MGLVDDELKKIKRSIGLLGDIKLKNDPAIKGLDRFESMLYDKSGIYKSIKDAFTAPARAYRGEIDALGDPRSAMEEAMNTAGMAQLGGIPGGARGPGSVGMITYHGSPHKFDKFDMSKIGTGEGAQAYGHGLYLAQSPKVGDEYARTVTGRKLQDAVGYQNAADRNATSSAIDYFTSMKAGKAPRDVVNGKPVDDAYIDNQISGLRKELEAADSSQGMSPQLYKVDIPDEAVARFLDWDKPLSQQAPEVLAALQKAQEIRSRQTGGAFGPLDMNQAGKDLIPTMGESRLKDVGIPGIRYLDGGSRNTAQRYIAKHTQGGENVFNTQAELDAFVMRNPEFKSIPPDLTSNFVLFDDQLPRILERNGEATGLQPWQPGEANGLLGIPSRPRNALGQEIPPTEFELARIKGLLSGN